MINLLKPREVYSSKRVVITLLWLPLMLAYIPDNDNVRIKGNLIVALLGVLFDITLYREKYKAPFKHSKLSDDLTCLYPDGRDIDDWKVNILMNRTIRHVSGYENAHGKVIITSVVYDD